MTEMDYSTHGKGKRYACGDKGCDQTFTENDNMKAHQKSALGSCKRWSIDGIRNFHAAGEASIPDEAQGISILPVAAVINEQAVYNKPKPKCPSRTRVYTRAGR